MFRNYPSMARVRTSNNGNPGHVMFDLEFDHSAETPACIENYLMHHGWKKVSQHPDTGEDLWQHSMDQAEYGYYKWEQAVAFQMFLFFNIGPTVQYK